MDWRPLLDDLAVTLRELRLYSVPDPRESPLWAMFLEQALALPPLVDAHGPPAGVALDGLADWIADEGTLLVETVEGPLADIGHTQGYLYNTPDWVDVCRERSALEGVRAVVAARPELLARLDVAELDRALERYSGELFERTPPPPGTPPSHWWWFEIRYRTDW